MTVQTAQTFPDEGVALPATVPASTPEIPISTAVRARILTVFDQIDVANTGHLTREDLYTLANQMLSAFRVDVSSPKGAALVDSIHPLWVRLARAADHGIDDAIGEDAFSLGWARAYIAADGPAVADGEQPGEPDYGGYDRYLAPWISAQLNLLDMANDGVITREAFCAWQLILGSPVDAIVPRFWELDWEQNGWIYRSDLAVACRAFYASPEDDAPGTGLFPQRPAAPPAALTEYTPETGA